MTEVTAGEFIKRFLTLKSDAEQTVSVTEQTFTGVRMGEVFKLAKEFTQMHVGEIEELLESPSHEVRVGAVSIMDFRARNKRTTQADKKALFELYLRRHDCINTWDLVDRSAIYVVGSYLADKPRDILYNLAKSPHMSERRSAIVSTAFFIRNGEVDDTFRIAEMLLTDEHDLIHKATGWMLRYAGDKDQPRLLGFLDEHAGTMPRAMLRYATEKLDKSTRETYLRAKKTVSRTADSQLHEPPGHRANSRPGRSP
jgi:3-methyladenine DNA glycosylase AlkD